MNLHYNKTKLLKKRANAIYATAYRQNPRANKPSIIVKALESAFNAEVGIHKLGLGDRQLEIIRRLFVYIVAAGLEDFRLREQRHVRTDNELSGLATKIVIEMFNGNEKKDIAQRIEAILRKELG